MATNSSINAEQPANLGSVSTILGTPLRLTGSVPEWQPYAKYIFLADDFVSGSVSGNTGYTTSQLNGASAVITAIADHPGVAQFGTGGAANGSMGIHHGSSLMTTTGRILLSFVMQLPVLSTVAETYTVRVGLGVGASSADNTDGAYFEYTDTVNGGAWTIKTANNSTRTTANTASTVDTNWHVYSIDMNAAGSSVSFYIDGAEVTNSPIATNLPGSTRTFSDNYKILKSNGTTTRLLNLDLTTLYKECTTARY